MFAAFRRWLAARDTIERRCLAVGSAVLAVCALQAAKGFWFLIPVDPLTTLVFLGVVVTALVYLFRALLRGRPACAGGLLLAMLVCPLANLYFQGARLRFWLQGGEAAYLRFAAEVRAKSPPSLPPLPAEPTLEQYEERDRLEKAQYRAFRQGLDSSLLNHHPTAWRQVGINKDFIQLSSGSGLTGSWGIEIHDQPDIPALHSAEETKRNPYLPRQKRLSPRVWYWESD